MDGPIVCDLPLPFAFPNKLSSVVERGLAPGENSLKGLEEAFCLVFTGKSGCDCPPVAILRAYLYHKVWGD